MLLTLLFVVVRTTPPRGWYFVVSCGLVDGFLAGRREGEHEVPPFSLLLGRINNSSANKKFSTNQIRTTKNNAARRTFPFTSRLPPPPHFRGFISGATPSGSQLFIYWSRYPFTEVSHISDFLSLNQKKTKIWLNSANSVKMSPIFMKSRLTQLQIYTHISIIDLISLVN